MKKKFLPIQLDGIQDHLDIELELLDSKHYTDNIVYNQLVMENIQFQQHNFHELEYQ